MSSLTFSQEEADTKVVLHMKVSLEEQNDTITIRSPSGDSEIVILVISLLWKFKERVILGDRHGKNSKKFRISKAGIESNIADMR